MRVLIKRIISEKIKIGLLKLWYVLFCKNKNKIEKLFAEYDISKIHEIPIFIINFILVKIKHKLQYFGIFC